MRRRSRADPTNPRAVIVGLDHINGIQAARVLAGRGVPVVGLVQDPGHFGCRTRLCEQIVVASEGEDAVVAALQDLGSTLALPGVLVPVTDAHVRTISRHRSVLEPWYRIRLPDPDVVEMLMDKACFYPWAMQHGFRVPRSVYLSEPSDAERATRELTFPCVLKPPLSATPEWERQSRLKAYIVPDPEALLAAYARLASLADVLIAQEWIPGPISNLYSVNAHVGDDHRPVGTFVARKLRQWPVDTGESSLGQECRNDEVLDIATRLWGSLAYRGLGYVEVKQHAITGEYVIIEPNVGRPTGRSSIAEAGGVDLLYAMYCDANDLPLPPNLEQQYGTVKWIHLRHDLQSAVTMWRRGDLSLGEWRRSLRGHKAHALFSWSDPGPFVGDLLRAGRLLLSARERHARDYETAAAVVTRGDPE